LINRKLVREVLERTPVQPGDGPEDRSEVRRKIGEGRGYTVVT
jgi:hypothetical protein